MPGERLDMPAHVSTAEPAKFLDDPDVAERRVRYETPWSYS
jgi:hypothetical protein